MASLTGRQTLAFDKELQIATLGEDPEERYFTLEEIARGLKISRDSARRLFGREPGVLRFNAAGKASTINGRVRMRIPSSVYKSVLNRLRHIA